MIGTEVCCRCIKDSNIIDLSKDDFVVRQYLEDLNNIATTAPTMKSSFYHLDCYEKSD